MVGPPPADAKDSNVYRKVIAMTDDGRFRVKVRFTEQQVILLDKLLDEGRFGDTHAEVVARVFDEYLRSRGTKGREN
jgi:hypothetical protein